MREKIKGINLNHLLLGIIFGILIVLGIRFVTYEPEHDTHYHANFAVFVDGKQEKFESPFYYEEVTACNLDSETKPEHRVHMHNNENGLIHVHADAVSWGSFFQNISWNIGKNYLYDSKNILQNNDTKKVTYILNGEKVSDITTRVIGNTDKLLVSYGENSNNDLQKQYEVIQDTAKEANTKQDPATCSGNSHDASFSERLKNIL